jgi:polar amino acid transport system substrate-binding protein
MAGMSITEERQQTIDFTQNYLPPDPSYYMVRSGTSLDFDALSGKSVGVQGATIQAGYVNETFGSNNTVKAYETADQALADLNAGNLDVILADASYVNEVVGGSGGALEKVGPDVMLGNGIGIGLRKADDELEGKLNAAIDEMKNDGSLDDLIVKWFPDKTKPIFATN